MATKPTDLLYGVDEVDFFIYQTASPADVPVARRRVQGLYRAGRPRADTSALVPELLDVFPCDDGDLERVQRQRRGHPIHGAPPDDPTRKHIGDERGEREPGPCQGTSVKSHSHNWFGRPARKRRLTRPGARGEDRSWRVVIVIFDLVTLRMPSS